MAFTHILALDSIHATLAKHPGVKLNVLLATSSVDFGDGDQAFVERSFPIGFYIADREDAANAAQVAAASAISIQKT